MAAPRAERLKFGLKKLPLYVADRQALDSVLFLCGKQVQLATKFANSIENGQWRINGRPEYVKEACKASLARLDVDCIDLYYQHRVDPNVPIEDTVRLPWLTSK